MTSLLFTLRCIHCLPFSMVPAECHSPGPRLTLNVKQDAPVAAVMSVIHILSHQATTMCQSDGVVAKAYSEKVNKSNFNRGYVYAQ